MAWTTPADWAVGEKVTAAKMNTHVRDNLAYLKAVPGTASQAGYTSPTRKIDGTVYQNTTGKVLGVLVTIYSVIPPSQTTAGSIITPYSDAGASPVMAITYAGFFNATTPSGCTLAAEFNVLFAVLPGYYYKVVAAATGGGTAPVQSAWLEYIMPL